MENVCCCCCGGGGWCCQLGFIVVAVADVVNVVSVVNVVQGCSGVQVHPGAGSAPKAPFTQVS